jgi:hypothetical protein
VLSQVLFGGYILLHAPSGFFFNCMQVKEIIGYTGLENIVKNSGTTFAE